MALGQRTSSGGSTTPVELQPHRSNMAVSGNAARIHVHLPSVVVLSCCHPPPSPSPPCCVCHQVGFVLYLQGALPLYTTTRPKSNLLPCLWLFINCQINTRVSRLKWTSNRLQHSFLNYAFHSNLTVIHVVSTNPSQLSLDEPIKTVL